MRVKPDGPGLGRVVLVEDDPADARLVEVRLRGSFEVEHFSLLADAERYLAETETTVDAALVALGLTGADDASSVALLRRGFPSLPIVVLMGVDDDAISALAVRDGAQEFLVKDVTTTSLPRSIRYAIERKQSEALRLQLQHSDRLASIGQLSAAVAHEINNPSAFVMTNTHLCAEITEKLIKLLRDSPPDEAGHAKHERLGMEMLPMLLDQREMLADSEEGVQRIRSIVRDLGSFSRIEEDVYEWIDIKDVVHLACNFTRNEVRHRASLLVDLQDCPPIVAHRARLSQVMVNMILNAAQAIEEGDPGNNIVRVTTRVDRENDTMVITIEDSGSGISQDMLPRLFEPFFTTKTREQGTGLGLSLCRDAILAHSGSISVESVIAKGTTFTITLPLTTGLKPIAPSNELPPEVQTPQRARVLLIDDEPAIRRAFRRLLRGHHDVEVGDAVDALRRLEEGATYDLILCDLMMPEIDGPGFYEILQARFPRYTSRILFVSGGAVTPRVRDFVAQKDVRVLDKPVPRDQLLQAIQQTLQLAE